MRSFASLRMTSLFLMDGGGKQGRFEEELTVLKRIYAKRPCFPPQFNSNCLVIPNGANLNKVKVGEMRNLMDLIN